MYTSPTSGPLASLPALYVKGDYDKGFQGPVYMAPDNLRLRFVCVKHRRNLLNGEDCKVAAVQRGKGVTNTPTTESITTTIEATNLAETETYGGTITRFHTVLFDFDISSMYCPENRVDEYMQMTDDDLKRWVDQHPWYINHEDEIENEFDCANHYKVMFELEEE